MAASATSETFNFQENDSPANTSTTLGVTSIFTEGGVSITASGFDTSGNPSDLFAKFTSGDPTETGLGMATDTFGPTDHEIDTVHFVQLDLSILKPAASCILTISSIQSIEGANVYATTTAGTLAGATLIPPSPLLGSGGAVQTIDITAAVNAGDFIDVQSASGNILIETLTATQANPPPPPLAKGDTATIGLWHNRNGQALIDSLNGGPTSTELGTWLAVNFNCLFGNLNGEPNTAVAAQFLVDFSASGLQKTYAQIMGVALASYVTSSTLAGGTMAAGYGFNVSPGGTGDKLYNVGSNGSAIGLSNNTSYTILQLLDAANANCSGGVINASALTALNVIFDGINSTGDI